MSIAARIKADVLEASARFPEIAGLSHDGECISFTLNGQEFTAILQGEYGGSCDVFGPDDFEVSCTGSVVDIVAAVHRRLEGCDDACMTPPEDADLETGDQAARGSAAAEDSDDLLMEEEDHLDMAIDPASSVEEQTFAQLKADMAEVKGAGYDCSIDCVVADQVRVTLSMPIPPTITRSTAEAWNLNRALPLRTTLWVHRAHYARSARETFEDLVFWQEKTLKGFTPLDCGVQLCSIARAFWPLLCGKCYEEAPEALGGRAPEALFAKKEIILAEAKSLPGVLLPLAKYMTKRLGILHEYCVICDEPLVFPPLIRPTVCTRMLCSYSARTFGNAVTGEFTDQNASLEVWDLLVCMALCTAEMSVERMRDLFKAQYFPQIFEPGSSQPALTCNDEGLRKLRALLTALIDYRAKEVGKSGIFWLNALFRRETVPADPLLPALVGWMWDSNRSYILSLMEEDRIAKLGTPMQYYLLSAPPEMEERFQGLKRKHGAEFCFHGSPAANWHCILRQGLKNASGTSLMTAGQAHGPGIYLARDASTSAGYSAGGWGQKRTSLVKPPALKREQTGFRCHDPDTLVMLAICEVALVPQLKKVGNIWVCPEEAAVVTRFLLVFCTRSVPPISLEDPTVSQPLQELTKRWTAP